MPAERSNPGLGKPRSSCTQCRKRKQRCNRIWPCNHCAKRAIGHLCHFDARERLKPHKTESSSSELRESSAASDEGTVGQLVDKLGYRGGLDHFNLTQLTTKASSENGPIESPSPESVLRKAVSQLPNRSLTDALVQSYLQNDNMQYYSIHPQTFLREYNDWWAARMNHQCLPVSWTALLLQVCANSVRGLKPDLRQRLQYDLAETDEAASLRFFDAARCIGDTLDPGAGGLCRVTHLLLVASWFKAGGQIVEGWHALSIAVREAQECGIDIDDASRCHHSDIEIELRRRTWSYIVVWDWQMAEWLSRPMLTEVQRHTPSPNPLLDECSSGQPSPVLSLGEQFKLVRLLSTQFGPLNSISVDDRALEVVCAIDKWMRQLPKELHLSDHVSTEDGDPHWLVCQRLSLHCFAYMARLTPLKRILTANSNAAEHLQAKRMDLLRLAVQRCIECMDMGIALHCAMYPFRANFHFVIFVLFDTATLICSALMHDPSHELPERPTLLQKAQEALDALDTLMQHARSAKRGAEVLRWLVKEVGSKSNEQESIHGQLNSCTQHGVHPLPQAGCMTKESLIGKSPSTTEPFSNSGEPSNTAAINPVQGNSTSITLEDAPDMPFAQNLGIEGILDLDLGGLESIWDWEGLGLTDTL